MAAAKKGKKTSSSKKSSKGRKKSGNSNFFMSFMLILLVLAMIATAVFLTLNNFNINKNDKSQITKEVVIKKEENKNVSKPMAKPAETKKDDSKKETVKKEKVEPKKEEPKKESQRLTNLSGCWLSNEQGAFITLDQYGYRIDFSNVDASKPLTGNYYIENNLIVFTTDGNECKGTEGTYRITFYKKNFSLICKDDDCTSRRNILEADWEWVEI